MLSVTREMQIKNHDEIPFYTHCEGYSKRACVGKNTEKLEPVYTAGDNTATMENHLTGPQKLKH